MYTRRKFKDQIKQYIIRLRAEQQPLTLSLSLICLSHLTPLQHATTHFIRFAGRERERETRAQYLISEHFNPDVDGFCLGRRSRHRAVCSDALLWLFLLLPLPHVYIYSSAPFLRFHAGFLRLNALVAILLREFIRC